MPAASLVLRLAGPLQSWGLRGQYNRRDTAGAPTKSGVIGLLAAAQGRRRQDSIEDLLDLTLGVRTDQPGSLLRDYHTASDFRGGPLRSSAVSAKGIQRLTTPTKNTYVTQRFYLQDAAFVVAVSGCADLLSGLAAALRNPAFPLALGRRACVPTQPLCLPPPEDHAVPANGELWDGDPAMVLGMVPWQAGPAHIKRLERAGRPARVDLPATVDDIDGEDVISDVPVSFDPLRRGFTTRRVRHFWVSLPTPFIDAVNDSPEHHDPFALLGW